MDPADARAILDAAKKAAAEDLIHAEEDEQGQQDDLEAAPLHLHTLREPALLRGTPDCNRSTTGRDPAPVRAAARRAGTPAPLP